MSLIEGVGNEVTQFFFGVFCVVVALLAWRSTAPRQNRLRRALILDSHIRNFYAITNRHRTMLFVRTHPEDASETQPERQNSTESEVTEILDDELGASENVPQDSSPEPIREMNDIVETMDSEASVLRNRRLAFFNSQSEPPRAEPSTCEVVPPSNVKIEEERVVEETESLPVDDEKQSKNSDNEESNIRIRLKYLNDDVKSVVGKLKEPLGEFKRRNFRGELSARKLVRLIFNGQVLKPEAATLESCGLFDNCVVHCLVHQPMNQQQMDQVQQQMGPNQSTPGANHPGGNNSEAPLGFSSPRADFGSQEDREWDLSNLLFMMIASLLSIGWYIRIRFPSFFGLPATFGMLGLTVIYLVAVICIYFPEFSNQHQRNRQRSGADGRESVATN